MKIRGSVVTLSFVFRHPPEDEKKKKIAEIKENKIMQKEKDKKKDLRGSKGNGGGGRFSKNTHTNI